VILVATNHGLHPAGREATVGLRLQGMDGSIEDEKAITGPTAAQAGVWVEAAT